MPWMAAFSAGVIILYCCGRVLPWHDYIFVALCVLLLSYWHWPRYILVFMVGVGWANWHVHSQLSTYLPASFFASEVLLEGRVCSLTVPGEFSFRLDFCAWSFESESGHVRDGLERRVRLSVPLDLADKLSPGVFRIHARLRPPLARLNPQTRSAERFWFRQGIVSLGHVSELILMEGASHSTWSQHLLLWRWQLREYFQQHTNALEHRGILQALFLGDRSGITPGENRLLSESGTQHLMAISGLHVGIIVALLHFLLPTRNLGLFFVATLSAVYVALVGAPPSALRAWLMAMALLLVARGYLPLRPGMAWWAAMVLVLLVDPAAPLALGFWYSFMAVACLLMMVRGRQAGVGWSQLLLLQTVLYLFLQGFNVTVMQAVHPLSMLANLVAIPWVSVVILPLVLLSMVFGVLWPMLAGVGLAVANEAMHVLLEFFASMSAVQWPINGVKNDLLWGVVTSLVMLLLVIRAYRVYSLLLAAALVCIVASPFLPPPQKDKILVWDAGQGLAVMLSGHWGHWWYDLGPAWQSNSLTVQELMPYIRGQGMENDLRGLILSHGDSDHVGGAQQIIDVLRPEFLWAGEPERHDFTHSAQACQPGMRWRSGDWQIEVIYVAPPSEALNANMRSCVVRVQMGGVRMLLMGDLEAGAERHFLRSVRDIEADVLVAGHHGSRNATSIALLKHVKPDYVVLPAPAFSRFGHPHADVIERIHLMGAIPLHVGRLGALYFNRDATSVAGYTLTFERSLRRAFWLYDGFETRQATHALTR